MPTALRAGPYRFFFHSGDRDEPAHVHVEGEDSSVKFWLDPVRLQRSTRFARSELIRIQRLVEQHREAFLRSWNEYFEIDA